jgi:hypothetical protein
MSDQAQPNGPEQDSARWLRGLCDLAQTWLKESDGLVQWGKQNNQPVRIDVPVPTDAYANLSFAFGLAQVRAGGVVRELLDQARERLADGDDAHQFLLRAYQFRVSQALDGKPHRGPLPDEYVEYMETMDRLSRYVADRLRKHSRVLEPDQRINPYRHWDARANDLERNLVELSDTTNRDLIDARVEQLLKDHPQRKPTSDRRVRVITEALYLAPRVGPAFGQRILREAVAACEALPPATINDALLKQMALLEKALFVAAHFHCPECVGPLVSLCLEWLQANHALFPSVFESLIAQCVRTLRALALPDVLGPLLLEVAGVVLAGRDLETLRPEQLTDDPYGLRLLLQVARGWSHLGFVQEAETVLAASRLVLFQPEPAYKSFNEWSEISRLRTPLAQSYAAALAELPTRSARPLLDELFTCLRGVHDTYTTNDHFSVSHIDVIEAGVLAAVDVLTRSDKPLTVTT